ncbi:MAG: ABC transporter ATP-binding protein, partial [Actinobacteria bacterium]|nr:ABC transporter ATP-binding protein [Actinomycetota bacterium]
MNNSPIIAENLVRHFGDVHAVKGINLEIKAG